MNFPQIFIPVGMVITTFIKKLNINLKLLFFFSKNTPITVFFKPMQCRNFMKGDKFSSLTFAQHL
jgi:hypothetical protein